MSGGGSSTTTTKNALPSWAVPYAQNLLGAGANYFMPGGQPGAMPTNMNQQVAGMTPDQLQAISMIQQRAGQAPLSQSQIGNLSQVPQGVQGGSQVAGPGQTIQGVNAPTAPGNPNASYNPPQQVSTPNPPPDPGPVSPPSKQPKEKKKKKKG